MITVSLNEADFEYDIHSLVKAFYPKEDVKVFADSEKIAELEEQISKCATDFIKLNELMQEKEKTEAELSDKMERWVYLNDLAEKIEAQKRENNNENI